MAQYFENKACSTILDYLGISWITELECPWEENYSSLDNTQKVTKKMLSKKLNMYILTSVQA